MCLLQRVWLNCIPMYFQTIAFSKYDMLLLFVLFHQFNHPNACIDYILWCSWWCRPQLLVGNISTIWFLLWFSFIPATWVQMMGCEAHVRVDYVIHCNTFFPFLHIMSNICCQTLKTTIGSSVPWTYFPRNELNKPGSKFVACQS